MADEPADGSTNGPAEWSPERLRAEVASRTWFHTIDLGHGVRTPGEKDTITEVGQLHLPAMAGRTVLDVGAYDGFYSFEAERQGAARVVAADRWAWEWPGSDARRNFELAHTVLASTVESTWVSVEDLTPEAVGGVFDVVLFLGVLYHAPDPLGYLRRVRSVTGGVAVIETVVDLLDIPVPAAAYYPGERLNGDGSNHFGPNPAAVEAWALAAGFSRVVPFSPWHTNSWWSLQPGQPSTSPAGKLVERVRRRLRPARSGRMVFHAYA